MIPGLGHFTFVHAEVMSAIDRCCQYHIFSWRFLATQRPYLAELSRAHTAARTGDARLRWASVV